MKCPFCGFENDKVVDSRESKEADSIRRRRECLKCGKRFTTYERIDEIPYMVVKKDGRREKFDRQKVLNGLLRACEKRPVPMGKLEQIVNEAEGFVIESPERERKTSELGELIMNRLRRYDKVAYVRFASVYLDFKDVKEFMYPQYSSTTTGSSLNEWNRRFRDDVPVHCVETFYHHPRYLDSVVEKVNEALSRFPSPDQAEIVFSAHSVPMSVIEKGDPYQRQIEETVSLVMQRGGWNNPHRLCYQSKVGASRWLQPSLTHTLKQLAAEERRDVCIVPIAFVSDHVETLGEIDHEEDRAEPERRPPETE